MSRPTFEADLAEAWLEVDRQRRLAGLAAREALERRWLAQATGGDPFHPRAQGMAAAADFHEARAERLAEQALVAARRATELEARLEVGRVDRCA
jgi:hypothetical protein